MKFIPLLLLAIIFTSAVPSEHVFARFMPQEMGAKLEKDTSKQKEKTVFIIKRIDKDGNEREIVHEFRGLDYFPDSLHEKLKNRLALDKMPKGFLSDSLFDQLRERLETLHQSLPGLDSILKNRIEERIIMKLPELDFESLHERLNELKDHLSIRGNTKNIEIIELEKKEQKSFNTGANNLKLDQFAYYPNPNRGDLSIEFTTKQQKPVSIKVYDLIGRVWYNETVNNFQGNYNKHLPIHLSKGVYILRIEQEGKTVSKKIIVE
jgi:hypothetical protein